MIRKAQDQKVEFRCIRGGKGETEMHLIAENNDELMGKGRLFNHMIIQPGNSIGEHKHEGDNEIFYFIKGTGLKLSAMYQYIGRTGHDTQLDRDNDDLGIAKHFACLMLQYTF